jgi:hypothetical protein
MLVAPRVPGGGGGSWNVTLPGLRPHGMNCYGTLPIGSGQQRIFTVVIFFVCGLLCGRKMGTANYVEQLIKLSEGKNSLYVPRIVVKKA